MKRFGVMAFSLVLITTASAQDATVEPAEVVQAINQFINENIDERALDALGVDTDRVRKFLTGLEQQFQGNYVFDLGAFRETAQQLLPVLHQFEETEPYAIWLQSRLDYFDAVEKLRKQAVVSKKEPTRLTVPSPKVERQTWVEIMREREMPPLAFAQVGKLKKIFAEERVPPELVWLAEVESSFNPKAKSPVGAAGLFQLMPATARGLDLSVGMLRDERLQPEKNARAAAQYLRQLHERFGDWRLALAAYNAGPARVSDLLKKEKARTFDEIADRLPAETQLYVPKVEATLRKREGRALADLKMPKA